MDSPSREHEPVSSAYDANFKSILFESNINQDNCVLDLSTQTSAHSSDSAHLKKFNVAYHTSLCSQDTNFPTPNLVLLSDSKYNTTPASSFAISANANAHLVTKPSFSHKQLSGAEKTHRSSIGVSKSVLNPAAVSTRYQPILPAKVPKSPPASNLVKLSAIDRCNVSRPFQPVAAKQRKHSSKVTSSVSKPPQQPPSSQQPHQTIVFLPVNPQSNGPNWKITSSPYKPILPAPSSSKQTHQACVSIGNHTFVQIDNSRLVNSSKVNSVEKSPSKQPMMEPEPKPPVTARPTSIVHPFNTSKKVVPIKAKTSRNSDAQKSPVVAPTSAKVDRDNISLLKPESDVSGTLLPANRVDVPTIKEEFLSPVSPKKEKEKQNSREEVGRDELNIFEGILSIDENENMNDSRSDVTQSKISDELDSDITRKYEMVTEPEVKSRFSKSSKMLRHFVNKFWIEEVISEKDENDETEEELEIVSKHAIKSPRKRSISVENSETKKKKRKSTEYSVSINDPTIEDTTTDNVQTSKKKEAAKSASSLRKPFSQSLSLEIPNSASAFFQTSCDSPGDPTCLLLTSSSTSSGVYSASEFESSVSDSSRHASNVSGISSTILSPSGSRAAPGSQVGNYPAPPLSPVKPPCDKPIIQWTTVDVFNFVKSVPAGSEYADQFRAQDIDGHALSMLKEMHLMSAMNMKLGPALKICSSIRKLKEQGF